MNAPCKDCEKRTVGCHSYCKEYKEFAKERDKIRQLRAQAEKETKDFVLARRKNKQ